ncbi:MAG TPA: diaminopimelate epimerase [Chitinophagaceae bacterium]|nr:diaminopimelate epimerase [Chitinophagaceae bacterium]
MKIEFYKYQGTGNDFILLDNRTTLYDQLTEKQITFLCNRHVGIGGDGLMLLNVKQGYDFEMKYYNSNGAEGSMCGNGGRCMVKFAASLGIRKNNYHFIAADGEHEAEIDIDGIVRLKMNNVNKVQSHSNHFILNTGSPHYVKHISDVERMDVKTGGRMIRYSKEFEKEGINVNFVETLGEYRIYVRTYERGVEDETLSCGTGVTASALVSAHNDNGFNRVEVKTNGGHLSVEFDKKDENTFENIWLNGPAVFVFKGGIEIPN